MEQEEKITGAKGWLKCKSELYSKIAAWNIKKVDQVLFDFADCSAEIMGLSVFVNGVEECHIAMRNEEKSFLDLKNWMESVLDEKRICSELRIDNGKSWYILHFEHLRFKGILHPFDSSGEECNADKSVYNECHDNGAFCIYDSESGEMKALAYCEAKQLIMLLYGQLTICVPEKIQKRLKYSSLESCLAQISNKTCDYVAAKDLIFNASKWLKAKGLMYSKLINKEYKNPDDVLFDFEEPSFGGIITKIYVNGNEKQSLALNKNWDPIPGLKTWMEDIADEKKVCSEMRIDVALKWFVFHYEHLGIDEKKRDIGLFCVCCTEAYSSIKGKITVMAICDTKRFVSMLYTKLLRYSSEYHTYRHIVIDWGFSGSKGIPANWSFYNCLKSPKIEWYCDPDVEPGAAMPTFKKKPCVKETVHMWCDYGGAVFWDYKGVCTGDTDGFDYGKDYENEIDLSDMTELEEWYDEFDKFDDPCDDRNDDDYEKWFKKGWHLAKEIRKRMPANVDLFYEWKHYLRKAGKKEEYDSVPLTVPDERLIKK